MEILGTKWPSMTSTCECGPLPAFSFGNLLAQTSEIGREYRRCHFDGALAHAFPDSTDSGCSFHTLVFG